MTEAIQQLMPQLERLSAGERAEVAYLLLHLGEPEDEPAEVEAAWKAEIARRMEDMRSGKTVGIPGDVVLARLREKYP